jgi:uncharacterized protein YndB with AHSA1/START domain
MMDAAAEPYVYEYLIPVSMPASQAETFRALTDEGALEIWFAEKVEIEPRKGGDFRFWGKHTFGTPHRGQANQKFTAFDPPRSLSFSWHVLGQPSEVTWTVGADGDKASKITVRHEFSRLPEGVRMRELIDDLWRLHAGSLCLYLMGDRDIWRPDFDDPSPEIRREMTIDAPPEKVFAALTKPELIKEWFPAPAPFVEPRVGGKYAFAESYEIDGKKIDVPPMTILEFVENRRLVITWPDWRMDKTVPDQKVSWTLTPLAGGRTKLLFEHKGFTRTTDVSDYPFGWIEFLTKIDEVAKR